MYQTYIPNFEKSYYINTSGQVFSEKRKEVKQLAPLNRLGYQYVCLFKNGVRLNIAVHRLMGLTFLPNPENKREINHIDGIKDNNSLNNLEWNTPKENVRHSFATGLQVALKNETHYKSKAIIQLTLSGKFVKEWVNAEEIKRTLGYDHSNIRRCCNGERKTSNGFKWLNKN